MDAKMFAAAVAVSEFMRVAWSPELLLQFGDTEVEAERLVW